MTIDLGLFALNIDPTAIAGACLWSLALYLGFSPVGETLIEQIDRWLNFADRSLYTSTQEFDRTRKARESQNALHGNRETRENPPRTEDALIPVVWTLMLLRFCKCSTPARQHLYFCEHDRILITKLGSARC